MISHLGKGAFFYKEIHTLILYEFCMILCKLNTYMNTHMNFADFTIKLTDGYQKIRMSYGKTDVLMKCNLSFR